MSKIERLSNLRAGVMYGAARVAPTTGRSWSLDLGTKTTGHPRYGLVDVAQLMLMQDLALTWGLAASGAARIVTALRPDIADLAKETVERLEKSQSYDRTPRAFALISRIPTAGSSPSDFVRVVQPAALGALGVGVPPILVVLDLSNLINRAIYRLERVLAGELGEYPEVGFNLEPQL